jgi:hypothetical protein
MQLVSFLCFSFLIDKLFCGASELQTIMSYLARLKIET